MPIFRIEEFRGLAINPVPSHSNPTGLFNLTLDRVGGYTPFGQSKTLRADFFPAALELIGYDATGLSAWKDLNYNSIRLLNRDIISNASGTVNKAYPNPLRMFPTVGSWQMLKLTTAGTAISPTMTKTPNADGMSNDTAVGTLAWTNPTLARGSADESAAYATGPSGGTSNYLKATFPTGNFSIPANATVLGIRVGYLKKAALTVQDSSIKLIKGGLVQKASRADTASLWPTSTYAWVYAGESTDLWGTTWTPTDINALDFGAVLSVSLSAGATAYVDTMEIIVYYSTPSDSVISAYPAGIYRALDGNYHYPPVWTKAAPTSYPYNGVSSITGSLTNPTFGLLYWVAGQMGPGLMALAEYTQTGSSLGMRVDLTGAPANVGANVYYYDSTNKNYIYAGVVQAGSSGDFTTAPTGEGVLFKVSLAGTGVTALHNNRLYEVSSELGIQDTSFSHFKPSKYDYGKNVILWSDVGGAQASISSGYIPEPVPGTTALVSHPGGLTIFSADDAYLLSGDPSSAQTVAVERYPSPVGCDAGATPAVWGSRIFTIWRGRLFMVSGGSVEEIGLPVWTKADPFTQVVVDPPNNDIVAKTAGNKIYRYDPERKAWSNNVITSDYKLLPGTNELCYLVHYPVSGLGSLYSTDRDGVGTTPTLKYGPLDLELPQFDKEFQRVYLVTDGYTGTPTLDVDVDGQTTTITGESLGQGRYRFRLPGYVGRYLTMTFNMVGATITLAIRPPIEIEYVRRRRYR